MPYANVGDMVRVHLTAQLKNGEVVYSTRGNHPFLFTLGQGNVIPGLEDAIAGMAPGEKKTVTVPAETTHGQGEATETVKIDLTGNEPAPLIGEERLSVYPFIISETPDSLLIDEKSPLASEDLVFDIELLEILE